MSVKGLLLLNTVKIPHNAFMKLLTYKSYSGHIAGIADAIDFYADNIQDLCDAFGAAVDDSLAFRKKLVTLAQTLELNNRLAHHRSNPNETGKSFTQLKYVLISPRVRLGHST